VIIGLELLADYTRVFYIVFENVVAKVFAAKTQSVGCRLQLRESCSSRDDGRESIPPTGEAPNGTSAASAAATASGYLFTNALSPFCFRD